MLAIRDDGQVSGSVSGGCVEGDLIERVHAHKLASDKPRFATYGVSKEQAESLPACPAAARCKLVLEPVKDSAGLDELLGAIERHELVARFLELETGKSRLEAGRWSDALEFDGRVLKTVHGPRWRPVDHRCRPVVAATWRRWRRPSTITSRCAIPREEYADAWDLPGVAARPALSRRRSGWG